ncbi:hypothetical protein DPMN_059857 [Dreissena polymorpha]|uniref:Uncharacterized protein n=1 Tax=Dreissena polymorpha TaxID=45954 RepID=A0A9D4HGZ1_DREPO|nr:hypothetical protein DPMN_059857 [Dreissena polymorpha]
MCKSVSTIDEGFELRSFANSSSTYSSADSRSVARDVSGRISIATVIALIAFFKSTSQTFKISDPMS